MIAAATYTMAAPPAPCAISIDTAGANALEMAFVLKRFVIAVFAEGAVLVALNDNGAEAMVDGRKNEQMVACGQTFARHIDLVFGDSEKEGGGCAAAVEGELGILSDENETSFSFEAEDENKAVQTVYTVGVKNRTAEEMLNMVSGSFNYEVQTENKTATIGGHEVHYFYGQGLESEESPDVFISTMTCYVDSVKDSCVLVSLASKEGALEELPSEEAMLADAEGIFASLKINQ